MDYTTLAISSDAGMVPEAVVVTSLYETLQQLSDARRGQGKRYELGLILCLLLLAKMAGQTSLSGATEWIRHRAAALAKQFGLRHSSMPCQMTYCNVLARVDAKQLDELLAAFFVRWEAGQRCGAEPSRLHTPQGKADHAHLAIDGKTLRATCIGYLDHPFKKVARREGERSASPACKHKRVGIESDLVNSRLMLERRYFM